MTIDHINQVLGSHGPLRRLLLQHYRLVDRFPRAAEDDDEDYGYGYGGFRSRRRKPIPKGDRFPKVPSERGKELMDSGIYGSNEGFVDKLRKRKNNVSEQLLWRRLGLDARGTCSRANRLLAQVGFSQSFHIFGKGANYLQNLDKGHGAQHHSS